MKSIAPFVSSFWDRPRDLRCVPFSGAQDVTLQTFVEGMYAIAEARDFERVVFLAEELPAVHFEKDANLSYVAGKAYRKTGRIDEAIVLLEQSLSLSREAATLYELGTAYRKKGLLDDSEIVLRDAVKLDDQNPKYLSGLAITLRKLDRTETLEETKKLLIQALCLGSVDKKAIYLTELGLALKRTGSPAEAVAHLRKAAELETDASQQARIRFVLAMTLRDLELLQEAHTLLHGIMIEGPYKTKYENGFNQVEKLLHQRQNLRHSLDLVQNYKDSSRISLAENLLRERNEYTFHSRCISPWLLIEWIDVVVKTGRHAEALAYLEKSLEIVPGWMNSGNGAQDTKWKELLMRLRGRGHGSLNRIVTSLRELESRHPRLISDLSEIDLADSPLLRSNRDFAFVRIS